MSIKNTTCSLLLLFVFASYSYAQSENKINLALITDKTSGVDIIITGEGFSEFGTRINGLVSCCARLETQATNREDHKIIVSERTTRRAVDLSESIAAKTALQAAGRELAIKTIEKIAEGL
jgi:hypothetical protein